jgi:hypothetical protein
LVGGVLALGIRAELFQPGLQFWKPEFFNQLTTMHGLIMVFGAIMPGVRRLRQLADPDDDRRARTWHSPRMNNWSFWLLPPAATLLGHFVLRAGRRARRRAGRSTRRCRRKMGPGMDLGIFALHIMGASSIMGLDQHRHHHPEHARAWHDADENAAVRMDVADHCLPADRRDAGARRAPITMVLHRPAFRHQLLQRRRAAATR